MTGRSLVTFWLADTEFAVDVGDVVEVAPAPRVTRVPGTCGAVEGIANWRGRPIAVLSLGALLKRSDHPPDVKRSLLVLRRPSPWGLLIGRPGRIAEAAAACGADPSTGARVVRTDGGLVHVLDAVELLGSGRDLVAREAIR
jgi:chemotaxis signal transduction protein